MTPPRRPVTDTAVKHSLLVFVEGRVTEEEYLTHYRRLHRRRASVEFDPFRGGPLQLVERAAKAKKKNEREAKRRGRAHDEVWCVFDVDEHPNFAQAVSMARNHGINLAISSPCIELWFLLHLQDQTAYIERHDAQSIVRQELKCEKQLGPEALARLEDGFDAAKQRARALDKKHEGDGSAPHANPSSGVWRIVDSISAGTK